MANSYLPLMITLNIATYRYVSSKKRANYLLVKANHIICKSISYQINAVPKSVIHLTINSPRVLGYHLGL